ncbi:MAG TPA: glycosyltransferase family 61 protein [Acetobacteraceae bacterium]|nr:glycosyltransferase family 61 protein [Acetobacteraceae bacterium]
MTPALEPFSPCPAPELQVIDADPVIEEHRDALYLPFDGSDSAHDHPGWGLYDRDFRLIRAAAYCRFPARTLVGQGETASVPAGAIEDAPQAHYVHAGPLILHYGHFLLATLSRLWPGFGPGRRFVWFSNSGPRAPFVAACLAGLGLGLDQFRHFTRPTRIRRLTVVAPAFEEGHFAHHVYRRMCLGIGERLAPVPAGSGPPVYLTRTGLPGGVKRVANEAAVCAALAALGVEIVEPERLSLAQQIALFGSDRVIMGTAGSAFHTAIFVPPRARLIAIELHNSDNQILLNRLGAARMLHLRPVTALYPAMASSGPFKGVYTFPDPAAVARDLLRAAQSVSAAA